MNNSYHFMLNSDFEDEYDIFFDDWRTHKTQDNSIIFNRLMVSGLDRPGMFRSLKHLECRVIPHGIVKDLYQEKQVEFEHTSKRVTSRFFVEWWPELLEFVVYLDENAHAGQGKIKVSAATAIKEYSDKLASIYMPGYGNCSFRHLQIGRKKFWLQYESFDDWRSNCGENWCINVLSGPEDIMNDPNRRGIRAPLYAIDYVVSDRMYAIDLNVSPGLRATGIYQYMSPKLVADEIKNVLAK